MHTRHIAQTRGGLFSVLAASALVTLAANAASGQVINERLKLLAADGAANDWFGYAVALDHDIVAVGCFADDDNGDVSGSVYLYKASTGLPSFRLLASNGAAFDRLGWSVSASGGIVATGAVTADANAFDSGAAYLFDASTGGQLARLIAPDGAIGDEFGQSIGIDGGLCAVGASGDDDGGSNSGSVYLFTAHDGKLQHKFVAADAGVNDEFGWSVAISGTTLAVGAPYDDDRGANGGAVYLFDTVDGSEIAKLTADDGAPQDLFGWSVAMAGGIVVVGAPNDDDNGSLTGSAYLFDAATGAQLHKILGTDSAAGDEFGRAVAIADGLVAIGAYGDDDNGLFSGSAYTFDASTAAQVNKLVATDGQGNDQFGKSIATSGGAVLVGAMLDDDAGSNAGSAYLFGDAPCRADLTGDGVLDFFDVQAFLGLFAAMDPSADWNGDTAFDFFDVLGFLGDFAAGCGG